MTKDNTLYIYAKQLAVIRETDVYIYMEHLEEDKSVVIYCYINDAKTCDICMYMA